LQADSVSVYETRANLSKLIAQAKAGFPFVITSHGKPQVIVQDIGANANEKKTRRIGFLQDELKDFHVPEDFNSMMAEEISSLFNGETDLA
jgi:prevent-host-death family protein